jgi:hypothetical protein
MTMKMTARSQHHAAILSRSAGCDHFRHHRDDPAGLSRRAMSAPR